MNKPLKKIFVKAHPKSKKIEVLKTGDDSYEVWVREAPDKGKANQAVIDALSDHLDIGKSRIKVKSGLACRHKVLEIEA